MANCDCVKRPCECAPPCSIETTTATSPLALRTPSDLNCSKIAVNKSTCQQFYFDASLVTPGSCPPWVEISDGLKADQVCKIVQDNCDASCTVSAEGDVVFTSNSGDQCMFNIDGPALFLTVDGTPCGVDQSGVGGHIADITLLSQDSNNILTKSSTDCGLTLTCDTISDCVGNIEIMSLSDCVDLTLVGLGTAASPHRLGVDLALDPDSCNLTMCTPFGLLTKPTSVMATGSDCLSVTATGTGTATDPRRFALDVIVDPTGGLSCTNDGVSVVISPDACNSLITDVAGRLLVPQINAKGANSDCASVTVTGTGQCDDGFEITTDLILSQDPDNAITCTPTGLFAAQSGFAVSTATDTCVSLTTTGAGTASDPTTVSATLLVDPASTCLTCTPGGLSLRINAAPNNLLTCGSDGLEVFVEDTQLAIASNSTCLTAALAGDGSVATPYQIDLDLVVDATGSLSCGVNGLGVVVSTDADNQIAVGSDNGLFVAAPVFEVDVSDTQCFDMSITGTGTAATPYVISGTPVIDPNSGLACTLNGLAVEVSQNVGNSVGIGTDGGLFASTVVVQAGPGVVVTSAVSAQGETVYTAAFEPNTMTAAQITTLRTTLGI